MLRRWRWLLGQVLIAIAPAQADAAFIAAHAAALAAAVDEQVALAIVASDHYLAMAPGPLRDRHAVAGVQAAVLAQRFSLAVELAAAASEHQRNDPLLIRCQLEALLQTGAFAAFVDRAATAPAAATAAVDAVFECHEAVLLPLAERALRSGDAARGRFVFQRLAAIEPLRGYRLGNLGLCLRQLGELAAARAVYERGRQVAPEDLELENDRGLFLRSSGELAAAAQAFARAWALDLAREESLRGRGPAITNLMHLRLLYPAVLAADPLADANLALSRRPDATMLKRLVLDAISDSLREGPRK